MRFYADLHVHSKYSRATSRDCDLEHLALWGLRKGLTVLATGDFTHPAWFEEIRDRLVPAEPGLFRLRPEAERELVRRLPACCAGASLRFVLSVEISTIYKRDGATRKVHHLIYAPDLDSADRFRKALGRIGNLASDGRPILGLDSRDLLEVALQSGDGVFLVPAHIWTPWFAALGSKSGFDSIEACYADLADHVFAVETGLSSDPPMNWRVSSLDRYRLVSSSDAHSPPMLGREASVFDCALDYHAMRRALSTGEGYGGTLELFPEEGKYHLDGHRACKTRLEPEQTRGHAGRCPVCGGPVTVGTMHRISMLADRPEGARPENAAPFRSLIPLPELVGEIHQVGPGSARVERDVAALVGQLGPELAILQDLPLEEIRRSGSTLLAEAIARLRAGKVLRDAGYDGEYGAIRVFEPEELQRGRSSGMLFDLPSMRPDAEPRKRARRPAVAGVDLSAAEAEPAYPAPAEPRSETPAAPPESGVLAGLDPEQREAARATRGPLLIVAGPGTGKTRTLTHRFAHLVLSEGVAPEQCLAITFTRKAAEEMRSRLEALLPGQAARMTVTTFHGLGLAILREQRERLGLPEGFRIAGEAERLALAAELFGSSGREGEKKLEELRRDRSCADRQRFTEALHARGLVDFDDLVELPVRLLRESPEAVRSYRERFAWISVDEYQDVDREQYELVKLLSGPDGNVCVIGDPDQAIYGFRGADVGFFLAFERDYPAARRVELTRNYRSSEAVVRGALQAIAPGSLVPGRALRPMAGTGGPVRLHLHQAASAAAEAEFAVQAIEQLMGGFSHLSFDSGRSGGETHGALGFSDFAVLYRTDAQSQAFVEAFGRAGMPFQKRGHDRLLRRPGVPEVMKVLRGDGRSGRPVVEQLAAAVAALCGMESDPQRQADYHGAQELLVPLAARSERLEGFLDELAMGAEVDALDPRADRISLLTLHASKGLEFPVVFVVGCEEGLLPLRRGEEVLTKEALDEERRLFFVGMTRAQNRLFLTRARRRTLYGAEREAAASPFLADIDSGLLAEVRATAAAAKKRTRTAKQLTLL